MNWLTSRVAELPSFADLHQSGYTREGSNLRRVPLKYVLDELAGSGIQIAIGRVEDRLSDACLYSEDSISAAQRLARAQEFVGEDLSRQPRLFTVALEDSDGNVVYLPDSDTDEQDFQLFIGDALERPTARLQLLGALSAGYANIEAARLLEDEGPCADGPCIEWGDECGPPGCRCHRFPDSEARVRLRLARSLSLRRSPLQVAVLKCYRWA
jgi:hypothetical protein